MICRSAAPRLRVKVQATRLILVISSIVTMRPQYADGASGDDHFASGNIQIFNRSPLARVTSTAESFKLLNLKTRWRRPLAPIISASQLELIQMARQL